MVERRSLCVLAIQPFLPIQPILPDDSHE